MRIRVNGEERELREGMTVAELLAELNFGTTPVAVERNEEIVRRANHPTTVLQAGDELEIVHFVGGG